MELVEYVTMNIEPLGRRAAVAATLRQILALDGVVDAYALDVSLGGLSALRDALETLAAQEPTGDAALEARRQTCGELARGLGGWVRLANVGGPGAPGGADLWFQAQIDAWAGADDPRQRAMAATAARELSFLRVSEARRLYAMLTDDLLDREEAGEPAAVALADSIRERLEALWRLMTAEDWRVVEAWTAATFGRSLDERGRIPGVPVQ